MDNKIIEKLEEELKDIKIKISELRKKGVDTKIVDLKIINIPSKINLTKVTENENDIKAVINLLTSLKKEINELELEKSRPEKDISEEAEEVYNKEKERLEREEQEKKRGDLSDTEQKNQ